MRGKLHYLSVQYEALIICDILVSVVCRYRMNDGATYQPHHFNIQVYTMRLSSLGHLGECSMQMGPGRAPKAVVKYRFGNENLNRTQHWYTLNTQSQPKRSHTSIHCTHYVLATMHWEPKYLSYRHIVSAVHSTYCIFQVGHKVHRVHFSTWLYNRTQWQLCYARYLPRLHIVRRRARAVVECIFGSSPSNFPVARSLFSIPSMTSSLRRRRRLMRMEMMMVMMMAMRMKII